MRKQSRVLATALACLVVLLVFLEWYSLHQAELLEDWDLARKRKPLRRIDPLE
jgi:hypothetical protein